MEHPGVWKDADLQTTLNYIQKSDLFLFQRVGIYHYQMNSLANLAVIKISIRCLQFANLYASGSPTCLQDILLIKSPVGLPLLRSISSPFYPSSTSASQEHIPLSPSLQLLWLSLAIHGRIFVPRVIYKKQSGR